MIKRLSGIHPRVDSAIMADFFNIHTSLFHVLYSYVDSYKLKKTIFQTSELFSYQLMISMFSRSLADIKIDTGICSGNNILQGQLIYTRSFSKLVKFTILIVI